MSQEEEQGLTVTRVFEQPPDSVTVYSEFAQVLGTTSEVTLQFYETIPGPPGATGQVEMVRTRLRATIVVSPQHAMNIGRLLQQQVTDPGEPAPGSGAPAEGQQ